jgi:NAD(P)H-hydrate epimerase
LIDCFRQSACKGCVIDADALNLAHYGSRGEAHVWNRRPHPRTVITPHPGELGRMLGISAREVQSDREGAALRTARQMAENTPDDGPGPVVVLKGAGTIVTDGTRLYVNRTGNPGMASGGSGDVLSGVIGAFIAQGMDLFDASVLAVYVHGRAGDQAARRTGELALTAVDIIEALPAAFRGVDPSLPTR